MTLRLLSPERILYEGEVSSVRLSAHDGSVGVLARHAPFIGMLGDGCLVAAADGGSKAFLVFGGFYQVSSGTVTCLTEEAIPVEELDSEKARGLEAEALKLPATSEAERETRRLALSRARLRLKFARAPF